VSALSVFNCSLCSLRVNPPTSLSFADVKRVCSLLLSTVARDPRLAERSLHSYFLSDFAASVTPDRAATNASGGTSTLPPIFIRFLPSFCFSSSLRFRVMSPP
jgi:hypothetical protein